jgi:hypothetical protein
MKEYLFTIIVLILILVIIVTGGIAICFETAAKPDIYITRTDSYRTIEGNVIWVLEYAIDGVVQNPGFNSREAMTRFREYMDTIGKVYQREEE